MGFSSTESGGGDRVVGVGLFLLSLALIVSWMALSNATLMSWMAASVALLGPIVAHIAGWLTVRRMRRVRAHIADTIPGLTAYETGDGTDLDAARRFDRAVDATFDRLASRFVSGAKDVRARPLAAELDLPIPVVATALDQLSDVAPYIMRVMDSGEIAYEFPPGATSSLKGRTLLRWPARVGWFLTAFVANFGSMWPAVYIGVAALGTFAELWSAGVLNAAYEANVYAAALTLPAGLLAYWLLTLLSQWLTTPLLATPTPGPPHAHLEREREAAEEEELFEEIGVFRARSGVQGVWKGYKKAIHMFSGNRKGRRGGHPLAYVLLTVLAFVALAVVSAVSWIGGIRNILSGRLPHLPEVSPGAWAREPQPVGSAFLELGDELALTLMSAVRRLILERRPRDEDLARRVVALAARQGGRVSGLDLTFQEGFSEAEAITVAARVTGQVGGQIEVSEAGDVDCVFETPHGADLEVPLAPLEAIELRGERAEPISAGFHVRVPVNVPGLNRYLLEASLNLATGAALAAIAAGVLVPAGVVGAAVFGVASAVALSTWALVGAARYGVRESVRAGLLRDARRGALAILRTHLEGSSNRMPRQALSGLVEAIDGLDPDNGATMVWAEVDLALSDVGVELALGGDDEGEGLAYDLLPLRERLQSLEALRGQTARSGEEVELDEVVVFETSTVTS
ncbi:MAG: hypothetical protein CMH51_00495 [Myxococcales bacterium]|nr:hypothetical protein [Myxococcales bacterium]